MRKNFIFSRCFIYIIRRLIIIDNYISKELLDVASKTNKKITIYTTDKFHDRFIITDDCILYHFGASFKDLGKKCFAINRIDGADILEELKNKLGP